MSEQQVRIQIPKGYFFERNPAEMAQKLGGRQLPLEYFDGIEYPEEGGMLCKYKIFIYPTKGVPTGPGLEQIGVIKKLSLALFRIAITPPMLYLLPLIFLFPKKTRKKALYQVLMRFIDIADQAFNLWYLSPKAMCTMCREIYFKVSEWIEKNYGDEMTSVTAIDNKRTEKQVWLKMLLIFCSMFEYDSAYRYPFQDIGAELNKEAFRKNPAKEIERLIRIFRERERIGAPPIEKFLPIAKVLKLVLMFRPKIKKRIIEIVDLIDFSGLSWQEFVNLYAETNENGIIKNFKEFPDLPLQGKQQRVGKDHGDWYHTLAAPTYDFGGIPFHTRLNFKRNMTQKWAEKYKERLDKEGIRPVLGG